MKCKIYFPNTSFPPLTLNAHAPLAEHLTAQNSPVLFGCRTGLCGTCLVEISGNISPPTQEEKEVLQIIAPHHSSARLACQVDLTEDIIIETYED